MLREAAPFYLAGAFTLVYARADVLLWKPLSFDTEVGAYRAAGQLVEIVKQLPVLLMTATFPQLARGYQDSRAALVRTERALTGLLLGGGFLLGGTLALAAEPIITLLFGRDFGRAVPALRTLAPAVPLVFVNCGVLHFFIARDRGTLNLAFAAVMVVVNAGMNLALDPRLGAVGAATATVVTEAMLFVCCLYALRVFAARTGPPPLPTARPTRDAAPPPTPPSLTPLARAAHVAPRPDASSACVLFPARGLPVMSWAQPSRRKKPTRVRSVTSGGGRRHARKVAGDGGKGWRRRKGRAAEDGAGDGRTGVREGGTEGAQPGETGEVRRS